MTTAWISSAALALIILSFVIIKLNQQKNKRRLQPDLGDLEQFAEIDEDIVSARKISYAEESMPEIQEQTPNQQPAVRIINVMTSQGHQFSGYELLQTLLSVGLRFGDMNIFHRHQHTNGKGPILFSMASVTEPGTFDMQTIGKFSTQGLSLFMQLSGTSYDDERYQLMLDTAKQLADDLGGDVCDRQFKPLAE